MEKYKIELKKSAVKELNSIPDKDIRKIITKIKSLEENPRPDGCVKLTGKEQYRIRQRNYRIIYSIEEKRLVIFVVKIGHRKDVFR